MFIIYLFLLFLSSFLPPGHSKGSSNSRALIHSSFCISQAFVLGRSARPLLVNGKSFKFVPMIMESFHIKTLWDVCFFFSVEANILIFAAGRKVGNVIGGK